MGKKSDNQPDSKQVVASATPYLPVAPPSVGLPPLPPPAGRPPVKDLESSDEAFFKDLGHDETKDFGLAVTPIIKREGAGRARFPEGFSSSSEIPKPPRGSWGDAEIPASVAEFIQSREPRHSCSFPGILKVVIPEASLVPIAMAVRVLNFSAGGALVEVHERHKNLDSGSSLCTRFFELKVAHSQVPELRGSVAWADNSGKQPRLGLKFHVPVPALVRIFDPTGQTEWGGAPPLPMPVLDPFPPTSLEQKVILSGEAKDALEVVVESAGGQKFSAPVRQGRFSIEIVLNDAAENYFVLRSQAGTRLSRRLPIEITYFSLTNAGAVRFDANIDSRNAGEQIVNVEFLGPARQAERVIAQMLRLLGVGDHCALTAKIVCRKGFDRRTFDEMKREGESALTVEQVRNDMMKLLED